MPETKFQTSFIPKQPVTDEPRRGGGSSIFFLISFLLIIMTAAAGAGVFIWNKTILSNIKKGEEQLVAHKNTFDSTTISQFTRLDNRIDAADTLLKNHISASGIFPRLQDGTLKTVQYNSFSYTNAGEGKIIISMSGEARDYESLALQAKEFADPRFKNSFRSPIFSSFSKGRDNVVFTFSSGIDPYVIQYYQSRDRALREASQAANQSGANNSAPQPNTSN